MIVEHNIITLNKIWFAHDITDIFALSTYIENNNN